MSIVPTSIAETAMESQMNFFLTRNRMLAISGDGVEDVRIDGGGHVDEDDPEDMRPAALHRAGH